MTFIADLHIHSHYSIATSKQLTPEHLDYWGKRKGIKVVGTGDCTHPGWLAELKEKLIPAEPGLYKLKEGLDVPRTDETDGGTLFEGKRSHRLETPRFLLSGEISTIYKKNGTVRKVHNIVLAPDFPTVETIQSKLAGIGNITSDGRPILGLDSRDLLEIVLSCGGVLVPAHIWTPWFSALGSKSGFDTIEECYDDLSDHIFAVETGLSSDPPMNWICTFLDRYTIISNSDAHSPEKLGREATVFDTELSYDSIINAMKKGDPERCKGTLEFFPQEGKYHFDGHRKCGIRWDPLTTMRHGGTCPVCGKKVTVGVLNRVAQLADRDEWEQRPNSHPFTSLIPLKEILSELLGVGSGTKKVARSYETLVDKAGSELAVLYHLPIKEVVDIAGEAVAEGVRRMRDREVFIEEGYDGEYGTITVFKEGEVKKAPMISFDIGTFREKRLQEKSGISQPDNSRPDTSQDNVSLQHSLFSHEIGLSSLVSGLNDEQKKAVEHLRGPAMVLAGPGTGKTRTLTYRIANLIERHNVNPGSVLALTFTNRAAQEIEDRLRLLLRHNPRQSSIFTGTFHRFGLSVLKAHTDKTGRSADFILINEQEREHLISQTIKSVDHDMKQAGARTGLDNRTTKTVGNLISSFKQRLLTPHDVDDTTESLLYEQYQSLLLQYDCFDFDDCLSWPVKLFTHYPEITLWYRDTFKWVLVDEYQDINYAQYRLVRELMPYHNSSLSVIGDPNQAIYGFRGADVTFIKNFLSDYPEAAVYKLTQSYRCSGTILRAADQVIGPSPSRGPEEESRASFLHGLQKGVKITIIETPSDKSEAEYVARTIERMMGGLRFFSMDSDITTGEATVEAEGGTTAENSGGSGDQSNEKMSEGTSLSDFAVLCRITRQMDVMEKAFNDHAIPYQRIDTGRLFREETAETILDLMKLALSPENRLLWEKLTSEKKIPKANITSFIDDYHIGNTTAKTMVYKAGMLLHRTGAVETGHTSDISEQPDVRKLMDYAERFGMRTDRFLHDATLGTNMDGYRADTEQVTLTTLHAAKGLEFSSVFIVGCEEGLVPYRLFQKQASDITEERRLLYVGMTRAKQILHLSYAKRRFLFGKSYRPEKSPFITRIEDELTELKRTEKKKKPAEPERQLTLF